MSGPTVPVTISFIIDNGDGTSTPFTATIGDQDQSDAAEAAREILDGMVPPDLPDLNALFQWEMENVAASGEVVFGKDTPIEGWQAQVDAYNAMTPSDPNVPYTAEAWAQYKVTATAQSWWNAGLGQ